jgi:hypothetical protein
MVRVYLQSLNPTPNRTDLDFMTMGTLTKPISEASTVSILSFNIPQRGMPLIIWSNYGSNPPIEGDTSYYFRLSYNGVIAARYIKYIDIHAPGSKQVPENCKSIYDISTLLLMFNTTLTQLVIDLNALIALPSLEAPRVIFENGLFSIIAPKLYYDSSLTTPIYLSAIGYLYGYFQSIPENWNPIIGYHFVFLNNPENTYLTNYLKITQVSSSVGYFSAIQSILITTSMPVESEIITSNTQNSSQSGLNVLQSFTINYDRGIVDFLENIQFVIKSEPFRRVKINCKTLYDIRCRVYAVDSHGFIYPFVNPANGYASITLEFL